MGCTSSSSVQPQNQTVFKSDCKWVYRIPALLYEKESETFFAFAEERRTPDDSSTKHLVMNTGKLKKDSMTIEWSGLKVVEEANHGCYRPMNPCPVYEKTSKTLFLFFIRVKCTVSERWQIHWGCNKARLCYITTNDGGQSWSAITDLTAELKEIQSWATFAVGPGHGLQTDDGRLIVPMYAYASSGSSYCLCCYRRSKVTPHALSLYREASGEKWKLGKMLENETLECVMAEFFDDAEKSNIYCNARSKGGYRVEALDKNVGADFITLPPAEKLVETGGGCQGSVVSFPAQSDESQADDDLSKKPNKWLLFTHPSEQLKRTDLGVYLNKLPSDPNSWSKRWIINPGPSAYSDLAYIGDGWFVCLMECGEEEITERIAYKIFSYNEVKQGIEE
uniref:sialidase-3-like n=1 Tax=Semicossyphus pulcher TaxID=241346 RepID=UPI0037E7B82A